MNEEEVMLDERGVLVSNVRIVVSGGTYPLSGVTSVKRTRRVPSPLAAISVGVSSLAALLFGAVLLAGALMSEDDPGAALFVGKTLLAFGTIGAATGGVLFSQLKPSFVVMIGTAGGDRRALTTSDQGWADRVHAAIEQAIVRRG